MAQRGKPEPHYGGWRIRWMDNSGTRRCETFANKKDAQFALDRHHLEKEEERRGLRKLSIPNKTFNNLCDYWIAHRLPLKRSAREDLSMIDRHLRPTFGSSKIQDIGIQAFDLYISKRSHLNPKTVNNHLTLLSAMLNKAYELKWIIYVPKIRKIKIHCSENYRYLKTKDEIRKFLAAAMDEGKEIYTLYATAVFTGLRPGELAGLEKSDVDFSKRMISVRRSYNGPTKSGKPRYVPILDPLLLLLKEWMLQIPPGPLFPNEVGTMHQKSARIFQEILHRVLLKAGFPSALVKEKTRRYIVFRDLRHTFASHWVMDKGDIFKLQKILGHQSIQMTMRYAHLAPEAFSSDYQRLTGALPFTDSETVSISEVEHSSFTFRR